MLARARQRSEAFVDAMTRNPMRTGSLARTLFLASYVVVAAAMLTLALRPQLLLADSSDTSLQAMRGLFVVACVVCASIGVAGLRRARWIRKPALVVHAVVALIALAGLVSALIDRPIFPGGAAEFAAKSAVHVFATIVWASRWRRAHFE